MMSLFFMTNISTSLLKDFFVLTLEILFVKLFFGAFSKKFCLPCLPFHRNFNWKKCLFFETFSENYCLKRNWSVSIQSEKKVTEESPFINCMTSSSNVPSREIWTGFTKKQTNKKMDKNLKCRDVNFFAVAQFLASCPGVNLTVAISWDILGLKNLNNN